MWQTIKRLREERGQFLADMKAILNTAETEKRDLTGEENAKFDELNTKAEARKSDIDRYETAQRLEADLAQKTGEQRVGRDAVSAPEGQADETAKEYRSQFVNWVRTGQFAEQRALTVTSQGVVGDRPFFDRIIESLKAYAGVLEAGALVLPTSTGNPFTVPTFDDTANTGRRVAEGATNNTETLPSSANKTLTAYKYESDWVKVSTELLTDAAFDVEGFIVQLGNRRIGRRFNTEATTGTGTGQPLGVVTGSTLGKTAAATNAITYDEFIDFEHSLDPAYRNSGKCKVMLHDLTLAALRKLKDGSGRYIWQPGAQGVQASIDGFGYVVNNDMANLSSGTGSIVALIGDFSFYFVRQIAQPVIRRANELFIQDGLIGFLIEQRLDGTLTDAKAVRHLRLA